VLILEQNSQNQAFLPNLFHWWNNSRAGPTLGQEMAIFKGVFGILARQTCLRSY
jgi:hypothetical protein